MKRVTSNDGKISREVEDRVVGAYKAMGFDIEDMDESPTDYTTMTDEQLTQIATEKGVNMKKITTREQLIEALMK